jgi:glutamyl-tRNA synthetase
LREAGLEPMAVASLAVLIGTSESVSAMRSMAELAAHFDPAATSRSASKFDPDELKVLNRALLHGMEFGAAKERLAAFGIDDPTAEPFWLAVHGNLDIFAEAAKWWRIVREGPEEQPELTPEDIDFVQGAFDLLPPEPWDHSTFRLWTDRVKEATGRKGRALFAPLRLALTGLSSGPELADLMPLMGREGILARRP